MSRFVPDWLARHLDVELDVGGETDQASHDRFRAILWTSLTTVMGLLPLLLEISMQAKLVIPLAISLPSASAPSWPWSCS